MSRLLTDPFTHTTRIVAPARAQRLGPRPDGCPFCPGNEHTTPEELARIDAPDGSWRARSVFNLFPIIPDVHEVLVTCARHITTLRDATLDELEGAVELWQLRAEAHAGNDDDYVHIFVNDGIRAGASLPHAHAQLLRVPRSALVTDPLAGCCDEQGCATCATAADAQLLITAEAEHGLVIAAHPAPRVAGALVIAPTTHTAGFATYSAPAIATVLHHALTLLPDGDFNVLVAHDVHRAAHWYIELVPRTATPAGLEIGLGMWVSLSEPGDIAAGARTLA